MIKLVVFDIDGVLTNGTYTIDSNGNESKTISFKDLDSLNTLKSMKIKTMFLTAEDNCLTKYFNKRFKPDIFIDGATNKYNCLKKYAFENELNFNDICYVGDGKKDILCIEKCGLSICPSNSIDEVKNNSKIVLTVSGGTGVIYEVCKILQTKPHTTSNDNSNHSKDNYNFEETINEHLKIIKKLKKDNTNIKRIETAITEMIHSLKNSGTIFACGNGGSAADAQHFAAELIGKFKYDRRSFPAIALTTNSSIITAIGNDYSFDKVFSRQIEGLGKKNDVLLAITTSGNSKNIDLAIEEAIEKEMKVILLTSEKCSKNNNDIIIIKVPSQKTERIQEFHTMIIHHMCEIIEREFLNEK